MYSLQLPILLLYVVRRHKDEEAAETKLPDFIQLCNYPDYISRGRESHGKNYAASIEVMGKRNCVMCGKVRVYAAVTGGKAGREKQQDHGLVIPRQNKGLCTACDVTVWACVEMDGFKIKWCKGCKNFRPWAAFGDKSMGTKCLKCRTRQNRKYAAKTSKVLSSNNSKNKQPKNAKFQQLEKTHAESIKMRLVQSIRDTNTEE